MLHSYPFIISIVDKQGVFVDNFQNVIGEKGHVILSSKQWWQSFRVLMGQ